jgi:Serine carboxypeptidase
VIQEIKQRVIRCSDRRLCARLKHFKVFSKCTQVDFPLSDVFTMCYINHVSTSTTIMQVTVLVSSTLCKECIQKSNRYELITFNGKLSSFRSMRFSSSWIVCVSTLMLLSLSSLASSSSNIEFSASSDDESSCAHAKDKETCFGTIDDSSKTRCVWCSCAAIPSECLTQEQSNRVPPGVFDCQSPSHVLNRWKWVEHKDGTSFCDEGSTSGYMSIDPSIYDKDGEDKHLFYWMFPKRNSDVQDSSIPFIIWLTGGPGCSSSL